MKNSLPFKIKGFIEWQLEHHKEQKKELESLYDDAIPSTIAQYDRDPVKSGPSDPTANAAIKLATNPYILALERSVKAVEATLRKCDDADMQLIELVYWKRSHTVGGAAEKVHLSKSGAYKRINRILHLISLELGYTNF